MNKLDSSFSGWEHFHSSVCFTINFLFFFSFALSFVYISIGSPFSLSSIDKTAFHIIIYSHELDVSRFHFDGNVKHGPIRYKQKGPVMSYSTKSNGNKIEQNWWCLTSIERQKMRKTINWNGMNLHTRTQCLPLFNMMNCKTVYRWLGRKPYEAMPWLCADEHKQWATNSEWKGIHTNFIFGFEISSDGVKPAA